MWSKIINYLKDPEHVAYIQQWFGVNIHYRDKFSGNSITEEMKKNLDDEIKISDEKDNKKLKFRNGHTKYIENGNKDVNHDEISYANDKSFTVTNKFWYYLFLFGTELGDEIFYSTFIPFWFWNIDAVVGRKVVLVWAVVMTIGQILKDILRWPRPACPPAARLQNKWSQEYGMPSTHAMISVSIPFSVLLFTMNRYIYSFPIGCTIAFLWCSLVSISRIYLGMHTILDIIAGLIIAIALMIPIIPLVDIMDYYFVTSFWALIFLIALSIITILYYPSSDKWTPTRGDTTMVVSVTVGVHVGSWFNYVTGAYVAYPLPPPYEIVLLSFSATGILVLRTIFGFCCVIMTKIICKSLTYKLICAILAIDSKKLMNSENSLENKHKILVDLVYRYIFCFMIGFNTAYLLPNIFSMIGLDRPTFYTEL